MDGHVTKQRPTWLRKKKKEKKKKKKKRTRERGERQGVQGRFKITRDEVGTRVNELDSHLREKLGREEKEGGK